MKRKKRSSRREWGFLLFIIIIIIVVFLVWIARTSLIEDIGKEYNIAFVVKEVKMIKEESIADFDAAIARCDGFRSQDERDYCYEAVAESSNRRVSNCKRSWRACSACLRSVILTTIPPTMVVSASI